MLYKWESVSYFFIQSEPEILKQMHINFPLWTDITVPLSATTIQQFSADIGDCIDEFWNRFCIFQDRFFPIFCFDHIFGSTFLLARWESITTQIPLETAWNHHFWPIVNPLPTLMVSLQMLWDVCKIIWHMLLLTHCSHMSFDKFGLKIDLESIIESEMVPMIDSEFWGRFRN